MASVEGPKPPEAENTSGVNVDISNALFVDAAFAQLMTAIHLRSGLGGSVRARAWVKNPDIEECDSNARPRIRGL